MRYFTKMKILAAVIPLVLLVAVRAEDPGNSKVPSYPDTCDYTAGGYMCGDQCVSRNGDRYCGSDIILPSSDNEHCCGESCSLDRDNDGFCRQGRTQSKLSHCNTTKGVRCFNSYQHSLYLGDKSHYTCPDTCVPWEAMCRGVSHCEGDHQVCGPHLRCPPLYYQGGWHEVTKIKISSSLVPSHHYCVVDWDEKMNDGKFDTIDRSDESQFRATQSPLDLDITSFTRCNAWDNNPGLMCGKRCRGSTRWCQDDIITLAHDTNTCNTRSGKIATNDSALCQHPEVWDGMPCSSKNEDGRVIRIEVHRSEDEVCAPLVH